MNLTLPHPQLDGLLGGTITRLCEVMDPQPTVFVRWGLQEPEPAYKDADGVTKIIDSPYPAPGEPLIINGHRFVVVERDVIQGQQLRIQTAEEMGWVKREGPEYTVECHRDAARDWVMDTYGIVSATWLWTAEVRKDDG